MFENVNKVIIVGGPGTGKSTLAKNLSETLKLPVYHLDAIDHLENWKTRDSKERDNIILNKIEEPKWVMDGTYKGTLEERIKKSDMIIFLNYSTLARLRGIFSRYFKLKGKERPEIPGCKEKMEIKFIKFTINWDKEKGQLVKEALKEYKNKNIFIFKNRRSLNKWFEKEFGKKIEISNK